MSELATSSFDKNERKKLDLLLSSAGSRSRPGDALRRRKLHEITPVNIRGIRPYRAGEIALVSREELVAN
jgi:hypothetical protein